MLKLLHKARALVLCARGNIGLTFALVLPVVIGGAGLALDSSNLYRTRSKIQSAVDQAALAGARELSLANSKTATVEERARQTVAANTPGSDLRVDVEIDGRSTVKVTATGKAPLFVFSRATPEVSASAQAKVNNVNLCMLVMEPAKQMALSLEKNSQLTAIDCSVYSNSKDKFGVSVGDSAMIDATLFCSAGGIQGKKGNFTREPLTDCPQLEDPLAGLPQPTVGPCDFDKFVVNGTMSALNPGVYCGGLTVTNGGTANLAPGVYTITDGKLKVEKAGLLLGRGVTFFLAGKKSSFDFSYDSVISLEAATTGPLAGILIFDDRNGKYEKHQIYSNDARMLLGTIYLPNGALYIDAQRPIADRSAYTVLITRALELRDGPNLTLNSDYRRSLVPVPQGVGPGVSVSLVR